MCGICGYVNIDGKPVGQDTVIRRMADALTHRGPDDDGYFVSGAVALGHRRLSIIDLEKGHQPISDDTGALTVVYNGEIYNFLELKTELINCGHVFRTRSDTEVLVNAYREWGEACLARFNGMFSFAIWDARANELFLARDRFGKKPLYYTLHNGAFVFASELKSLYRHPAIDMAIDLRALFKYCAHDYIPAPYTIIKDVYKLEPGHFLLLKGKDLKRSRYWDFSFKKNDERCRDLGTAKARFLDLLHESVRRRLISDVPLGVFLSGGLDSSAIVAAMTRFMDPRDIKTFSIGFKERSYDESDAARIVASHFKTDHREMVLGADTMTELLPKVIGIIDEPFADSSIIPTYLVSSFTREHVKVALGGDGGDELFMGYPSFIAHRLASFYEKIPSGVRRPAEAAAAFIPGGKGYMSLQFKLERFLRGIAYDKNVRHQVWIGSFPPHEQRALFACAGSDAIDTNAVYDESIRYCARAGNLPPLDIIQYLYIKTYLVDDILTKVDRASMATSLEVRAPFLDVEMADFSAGLSHELKLHGLTTKHVMKEALRGILPDVILKKKKHGFSVPLDGWFRGPLKAPLMRLFERASVERDGIFRHGYISSLINEHVSGRRNNGRKLWALFIFQAWYNKWIKKEEIIL